MGSSEHHVLNLGFSVFPCSELLFLIEQRSCVYIHLCVYIHTLLLPFLWRAWLLIRFVDCRNQTRFLKQYIPQSVLQCLSQITAETLYHQWVLVMVAEPRDETRMLSLWELRQRSGLKQQRPQIKDRERLEQQQETNVRRRHHRHRLFRHRCFPRPAAGFRR